MKFVRYRTDIVEKKGILDGDMVRRIHGSFFDEYTVMDEVHPVSEVTFLPPVIPSKMVCVARNYAAHAKELGNDVPEEPLIFLKPSTCVIAHNEAMQYPSQSSQVDHEGELGVVIGKRCSQVSVQEAPEYIFGYTLVNDFTARDIQKKENKFTRAKCFDTFAPLGPVIDTEYNPAGKMVRCYVNGELKQEGSTEQMIFDVPALISFISQVMTLLPGDVIATGTPPGVGPVQPGDLVTVDIEGLGVLVTPVEKRVERV